jgi:hypothetical protein
MARMKSFLPSPGASLRSRLVAAGLCLAFWFWASDVVAAERIRNPKIGVLYVYSARLAAMDIGANTFTVRGIIDNRENLTLAVKPSTKLSRAGKTVALREGKIGEAISGTLMINAEKKVVAVATTFGAPLPPKAPLAFNLAEVNGLASAGHVRDPIRGNVVTSTISMPTGR